MQPRPPDQGPVPADLPLGRHLLFATPDLDEARERVARIFCPHQLQTQTPRAPFSARHHHLRGHRLSLNYIEYGARTLINPGELGQFYLLQVPLSGGADIANGSDRYASDPRHAALLNPHRPTRMIWAEGTRQILVQIDRAAVEDAAGRAVTFDGPLDLASGPGSALRRLLAFILAEADRGGMPIGPTRAAQAMERSLIAAILDAHPATAQHGAHGTSRPLDRAVAHVHAHLGDALTLDDIATAAGVGPRALQLLFRQHLDTTPRDYLRQQRLDAARADLAAGRGSVTDVATRWGFTHFGRFAQDFRARHGILPREVRGTTQPPARP